MKTCTFFGHRNAPAEIEPVLQSTIIRLIEHHAVSSFYVGNQGRFDSMVRNILRDLTKIYPIHYAVVLAYLPKEQGNSYEPFSDTLVHDGIESVHPRYAIVWRNRWMIEKSDCVVSYIRRPYGGAAHFSTLAEKKKKEVIKI